MVRDSRIVAESSRGYHTTLDRQAFIDRQAFYYCDMGTASEMVHISA